MTSLRRRLANAACAFQTGHSVRDLERAYRRRVHLLMNRIADRLDREAAALEGESSSAPEYLRSRAARLRELAKSYLQGLDRDGEADVLGVLEIERIHLARRRWEETANVEALHGLDDRTGAGRDASGVLMSKFAAKLHEGLFEDPGLYLCFYEHRIGTWNWHRFLLWLRQSVRQYAVQLIRACGPP